MTANAVVTNLHVLEGGATAVVKSVARESTWPVIGVSAASERHDLAVLDLQAIDLQALRLSEDLPVIGDQVFAFGNPEGLEGTFSSGIVSGIRDVGPDKIIQLTAPISPGSSGGPVLNDRGEVLGIATATYSGGQNLNFAIPARYLSPLLQTRRAPQPLVSGTNARTTQSILGELGKRSIEGVSCENFVWSSNYDNQFIRENEFSFTVRNHLRSPVENVVILVVFHGRDGNPLDYVVTGHKGLIPAGLAKRVRGAVDYDVKNLTTSKEYSEFADRPNTKLMFRVLDFRVRQ